MHNELGGLCDELFRLPSLAMLKLDYNSIPEIPPAIERLAYALSPRPGPRCAMRLLLAECALGTHRCAVRLLPTLPDVMKACSACAAGWRASDGGGATRHGAHTMASDGGGIAMASWSSWLRVADGGVHACLGRDGPVWSQS